MADKTDENYAATPQAPDFAEADEPFTLFAEWLKDAGERELNDAEAQSVSLLGSSTESAVAGGVLYTAVALVDRACQDLIAELGHGTRLLLTGGDAPRILPLLGKRPRHDARLVLKGLSVFAEGTAECVT